jgi:hypothetical protein
MLIFVLNGEEGTGGGNIGLRHTAEREGSGNYGAERECWWKKGL